MRDLSWRDNNCAIKCMISVVKLCKASKNVAYTGSVKELVRV